MSITVNSAILGPQNQITVTFHGTAPGGESYVSASVKYGSVTGVYGHTVIPTGDPTSGLVGIIPPQAQGSTVFFIAEIVWTVTTDDSTEQSQAIASQPGQPDRETVYEALKTVLDGYMGPTGTNPAVTTLSRRIIQVDNCVEANAPYLFITQGKEPNTAIKGIPQVRDFQPFITVYAYTGNEETVITSTALNALVTSVENALGPDAATAFQQLGVPVSSCMVSGAIEYFEGVLGVWGVAVIPVRIVANY